MNEGNESEAPKRLSSSEIRDRNKAEELATQLLTGTDYEYLLTSGDPFYPVIKGRQKVVVGAVIGEVEVLRGRTLEDKPLVRHAVTKRRFKGSGRFGPPEANEVETGFEDIPTPHQALQELKGKPDNFRETLSYRESFEVLFPAGGDISDRGSLAWWFDQAWSAAEGSPQLVECPHPELHKDKSPRTGPLKHVVAFKKEPNLIFKMIELAVGKAQQTVNVNINEEKLVQSLEYRVIDVKMQDFKDKEVSSRIKLIEEYGYDAGVPQEKERVVDVEVVP